MKTFSIRGHLLKVRWFVRNHDDESHLGCRRPRLSSTSIYKIHAKTLLPLYNRPVIDYSLATIRRAGIKDITIISNKFVGQITSHVGQGLPDERIHYVIEEEPLGLHTPSTSHALTTKTLASWCIFQITLPQLNSNHMFKISMPQMNHRAACSSLVKKRIPKLLALRYLMRKATFATWLKSQNNPIESGHWRHLLVRRRVLDLFG